ncbi:histamine N-methyltransferase-like [Amphiura filiformis]|uniref:histamine N-methyltransferase-like n=1 Tax=Amphiura filiformis TaxID=82378 RepID=UPI003B21087B
MATVDSFIPILSVLDDEDHFLKCFDVFMKRLQEKDTTSEDWLADIVADIRPKVVQSVDQSTKGTLKALGVGSGDGRTEDYFISHFKAYVTHIHQCLLEPNRRLAEQHQKNTQESNWKEVIYDWREETLEEYMEGVKESGTVVKYHFISAIHSLFYMTNPEETLGFLYDQLEDNGILLIVMASEKSIASRIALAIPSQYNKVTIKTSRFVLDYFDTRCIPYTLHIRDLTLDMSGYGLDQDVSEEASLLLDFFTHIRDFCKTPLPPRIKDNVFFNSTGDCGKSIQIRIARSDIPILFYRSKTSARSEVRRPFLSIVVPFVHVGVHFTLSTGSIVLQLRLIFYAVGRIYQTIWPDGSGHRAGLKFWRPKIAYVSSVLGQNRVKCPFSHCQ